jgi:hypothetical protein
MKIILTICPGHEKYQPCTAGAAGPVLAAAELRETDGFPLD